MRSAPKIVFSVIALMLAMHQPAGADPAPAPAKTFSTYILKAVDKLSAERVKGGYDIKKAFTQDLSYGASCCIKASAPKAVEPGPNPTMCVAAVTEIIVEALNIYSQDHPTTKAFDQVPISSWTKGTRDSLRANVFMFKGSASLGTAFSLERFGIGEMRTFDKLEPGSFVNLNRTSGTGHAVVFLSYLKNGESVAAYEGGVNGFRYFSAQGKGRADAGFGTRNAYFKGHCPAPRKPSDDCNVIPQIENRADGSLAYDQVTLNSGVMFDPSSWDVLSAEKVRRASASRGFESDGLKAGEGLERAVTLFLEEQLEADWSKYEDGSS